MSRLCLFSKSLVKLLQDFKGMVSIILLLLVYTLIFLCSDLAINIVKVVLHAKIGEMSTISISLIKK
jgi:hypothetical protein